MKNKILSIMLMELQTDPKSAATPHAIYQKRLYDFRLTENYIIESIFFKERTDEKYLLEVEYPLDNLKVKQYYNDFIKVVNKTMATKGEVSELELESHSAAALQYNNLTKEELAEATKGKEDEINAYISYCYIRQQKNIISSDVNKLAKSIIKKYSSAIISELPVFSFHVMENKSILKNWIVKVFDEEKIEISNCIGTDTGCILVNPLFDLATQVRFGNGRQIAQISVQPNLIHINDVEKTIEIFYLKICDDIFQYHANFKTDILHYEIGLQEIIFKHITKEKEFKNYKIKTSILCVDPNNMYIFPVRELTLKNCKSVCEYLIDSYFFHINTKRYDMPKEYITKEIYL